MPTRQEKPRSASAQEHQAAGGQDLVLRVAVVQTVVLLAGFVIVPVVLVGALLVLFRRWTSRPAPTFRVEVVNVGPPGQVIAVPYPFPGMAPPPPIDVHVATAPSAAALAPRPSDAITAATEKFREAPAPRVPAPAAATAEPSAERFELGPGFEAERQEREQMARNHESAVLLSLFEQNRAMQEQLQRPQPPEPALYRWTEDGGQFESYRVPEQELGAAR